MCCVKISLCTSHQDRDCIGFSTIISHLTLSTISEGFIFVFQISVSSLKPKHTCKDEEYIPSEYSLSSDGNKQTKYKAIVIAVLFISCLMVLAVSGAIVFIFRHSSQNNKSMFFSKTARSVGVSFRNAIFIVSL